MGIVEVGQPVLPVPAVLGHLDLLEDVEQAAPWKRTPIKRCKRRLRPPCGVGEPAWRDIPIYDHRHLPAPDRRTRRIAGPRFDYCPIYGHKWEGLAIGVAPVRLIISADGPFLSDVIRRDPGPSAMSFLAFQLVMASGRPGQIIRIIRTIRRMGDRPP